MVTFPLKFIMVLLGNFYRYLDAFIRILALKMMQLTTDELIKAHA